MSLRIGDIVRTKDVVGILDGAERGPGHHEYYKVIQLNPKGDVVLQSGTGAQSVWEPQQVEVTTYGCYLAELIAEAKHHLGWVSADCNKILQQYAPDNLVNLEALEFLKGKIAEKIQSALDVKYEEIASAFFAERAGEVDPMPPIKVDALDFSPLDVQITPDSRLMMANTARPLADPFPSVEELLRQAVVTDPWADLMGGFDRVAESNAKASEAVTRAQDACDKALASIESKNDLKDFRVFSPGEELSLTKLGELTGKKTDHLNKLIERGVLPPGRKVGRVRWMPAQECYDILMTNKEPYKHWQKQEPAALANTWDSLL